MATIYIYLEIYGGIIHPFYYNLVLYNILNYIIVIFSFIDGFINSSRYDLRILRNTAVAGAEGCVLPVRCSDEGYA